MTTIATIRFPYRVSGRLRFGIPLRPMLLDQPLGSVRISQEDNYIDDAAVVITACYPDGSPRWISLAVDATTPLEGEWSVVTKSGTKSPIGAQADSTWHAVTNTDVAAYQMAGMPFQFSDAGDWLAPHCKKLITSRGGWYISPSQQRLSYLSYLHQEYDPAVILWREGALRGNESWLRFAYDAAREYLRDSVTAYGGCFQHRAPLNSLVAQFASLIAHKLTADGESDYAFAFRLLGQRAADQAKSDIGEDQMRGLEAQPLQIARCALEHSLHKHLLSHARNTDSPNRITAQIDVATVLAEHRLAQEANITLSEIEFRGWSISDVSADPITRHEGGHCLAENLVVAYLMTGDPEFRDCALAIAEDHTRVIIPRELRELQEAQRAGRSLRLRAIGWPLLNITAVATLLPSGDSLLGRIVASQQAILSELNDIDISRSEGSIHTGVLMEALLAVDTQDSVSLAGQFARAWTEQYISGKGAVYKTGDASSADVGFAGLCLAGFAMDARDQYGDALALLKATEPAKSAHITGMRLRQVHRAARLVETYEESPKIPLPIPRASQPLTTTVSHTGTAEIASEAEAANLKAKIFALLRQIQELLGQEGDR